MERESSPGRPSTSPTDKSSLGTSGDSIINRKREYRGLPSSFSSNLGRIRPSPSPTRAKSPTKSPTKITPRTPSGNQVKDIVAWLESSADKSAFEKSTDAPSSRRSTSSSTAVSAGVPAPFTTAQPLKCVPDVEEYSLTLLKYRQFYNAPLGRCLDRNSIKGDTSERSSRRSSRILSSNGSVYDADADTPKPAARIKPLRRFRRDPQEVRQFWKDVREYLWISDDELEGNLPDHSRKPDPPASGEPPRGLPATYEAMNARSSTNSSSHKPHLADRKSHSSAHTSSLSSTLARPPRVWSVEEKMSEIDAFLDEEPSSMEHPPTAPVPEFGMSQEAPEVRPRRYESCQKLKTNSSSSDQAFTMV